MVRFKNRYLLVQIHFDDQPQTSWSNAKTADTSFDGRTLHYALKDSLLTNFGDHGAGKTAASTNVKYYSPHTTTGIVRCARDDLSFVWAALTLMSKVKGPGNKTYSVTVRVMHVSGTIKSAQTKAIKFDTELIRDMVTTGVLPVAESQELMTRVKKEIEALEM
ncbi:uncharacterized protein EV422DRAFT_569876 [Fimicolochytrium jonesii]|uniref:uncharacterized protein n=1 Tax=Fimicolochytrium jonesii TaxID=1396493 RepID=UPI0022FDEA05|nr:uncharacterized protein EV422DRAFT_569876 [Fimicolochytrium jonesii]KAI8818087.1 hypothetical protein EV422DRAFT_569876 [Fimicolochytrium jonesii]